MSYDLVFWKGSAHEAPDRIWARLTGGETVEGIEPLLAGEVMDAFQIVFGSDVKLDEDRTMLGPGFELRVSDGDAYAQICCSWALPASDQGYAVLSKIRRAGERLGATVFDPQTAETPVDAAIQPASAELARLGEARIVEHSRSGEDRAQSFGRLEVWRVAGLQNESKGIHSLFLQAAGDGISSRHASHPSHLSDVVCDYARLVQSVLPFDVLVACGRGRARDGTICSFGNRVLAIVDGRAGFLGSPRNTLIQEDGATIGHWTNVQLSPTGPLASPRGPTLDLTDVVARAARDALSAAHEGRTRPLRDWMVLMASIDCDGLAVEELFASEVPPGEGVARSFEAFDSGAIMPLWSQRQFGAVRIEARLRLPESGGFALRLITQDRQAPQRHRLAPPVGPSS